MLITSSSGIRKGGDDDETVHVARVSSQSSVLSFLLRQSLRAEKKRDLSFLDLEMRDREREKESLIPEDETMAVNSFFRLPGTWDGVQ